MAKWTLPYDAPAPVPGPKPQTGSLDDKVPNQTDPTKRGFEPK